MAGQSPQNTRQEEGDKQEGPERCGVQEAAGTEAGQDKGEKMIEGRL
jgi:hypothetical protein